MTGKHELDTMFYPRSVAVVGASSNPAGWGGTDFLTRLRKMGFAGGLYPVNPRATEIQGLKAYPDVKSIPETLDFVIVGVPAPRVPGVLEDCIAAGVKNVHIFSSGFSETGEEEGRKLDEEIVRIIRRGGLRVVGPNCMGIYVPASKLVGWGATPHASGPVAFLSQSGGHAETLSSYAQEMGVYFSKVISFGNARGLQALDFLEYLAQDPETKIITMYLEGLSDGNRVTRLIKEINRTKPVIVWKGGLTETGSRAVASHTASLAGEERMWNAFYAQTGAVRANSLEEIVDVAMTFLHLTPPRGRRALLLGGGGGNSVALADICSREGLEVPTLSPETRRELANFIPLAGNSVRNPLDVWIMQENVDLFRRCIEIAVADPAVDLVIIDRHAGDGDDDNSEDDNLERWRGRKKQQKAVNNFIIQFARNDAHGKPVVIAMNVFDPTPQAIAAGAQLRKDYAQAGVPAYTFQANAARAMARFIKYHEFKAKNGDDAR